MWQTEYTAESQAGPDAVWRLMADVTSWPRWNKAVEQVELDGPFEAGTPGRLTPPGQEPLPFRVVEATPGEGYVSETDIAETVTLRAENSIVSPPDGAGCQVVLRVCLVGPAADYFGQSFGPAIAAGLPKTGAALVAESQSVRSS
jgi:hypothetical protein